MTGVVMGAPLDLTRSHRQQRLGAVERLDLRLLVDAQHQSPLWRRQVEADDVAHLLDEQRIVRQLERLAAVRLQSERAPDAVDGRWRVADRPAIARKRPVRRAGRGRLQGQADGLGDRVVADPAGCPGTWLVEQPIQPLRGEAPPPLRDRVGVGTRPRRRSPCSPAPAAASTIRARRAIACPVLCARASDSSSRCSASLSSIATAAFPIAMLPRSSIKS